VTVTASPPTVGGPLSRRWRLGWIAEVVGGLAIYLGFELDLDLALTLSVILLAISFVVLFLVKGALRQRVRAFS